MSSGAKLVAGVNILLRDKKKEKPIFQLLIYPATNLKDMETTSYHDYAENYCLTKDDMQFFVDKYLKNKKEAKLDVVSME